MWNEVVECVVERCLGSESQCDGMKRGGVNE